MSFEKLKTKHEKLMAKRTQEFDVKEKAMQSLEKIAIENNITIEELLKVVLESI